MRVIMFGASRRVGKDTASDLLLGEIKAYWPTFEVAKFSFAKALRDELQTALQAAGWPLDVYSEDPVIKEKIIRPLLVAWGAGRRVQNPDYWVDKMIGQLSTFAGKVENGKVRHPVAIISDWRYPNELDKIRAEFKEVIGVHIERPGVELAGEEPENDLLCRGVANYQILNDGTLGQFQFGIIRFLYSELYQTLLRK